VLTLLSIVAAVVAAQVGWVAIGNQAELRAHAKEQSRSTVEIPAMRGRILDRNDRSLAVNTARYTLALDPTVAGFESRADEFYHDLAALTERSAIRFRERVDDRYSPQYVELYDGLTARQQERIREWDVPGLIFTPRFARRYIHGRTLSHVLGHVGKDGHGLAGVELAYDDTLSGASGRRVVRRDRSGRIRALVGGRRTPPEHGENLVLTIDLVRQTALEDELRRGVRESDASWATAVAMDPSTGAVMAMANVPNYNPNRPGVASDEERRNRAITDRYEPGSTFKLVGAAAAVEEGVVSMGDSMDTGDGWAVFHGNTIKDISAYGTISFEEVIAKSSNVGMATVVRQLDAGTFYQYARNMGFGHRTWIDLPGEAKSVLKRPPSWSRTTQTAMAIGYEVAVTPLQLTAAYSALANGGQLLEPYVVAERRDMKGGTLWQNERTVIRRVFSRKTARALRPAFERAVEEGTATAAGVEGLRVAGKTGTALHVDDGSYAEEKGRASFVGFFPADDPEVTLLVMMGAPETSIYGGEVAAPVFRRVARRWAGTFPDVLERITAHRQTEAPTAGLPNGTPQLESIQGSRVLPSFARRSVPRTTRWEPRQRGNVHLDGIGRTASRSTPPLRTRVLFDGAS